MTRLKFLTTVNPTLPRNRVPLPDDEVTFLPMEHIGENGELDLSLVRPAREISQGYTAMLDGDVVVAKITPCFENGKGALCSGLKGGVGFGTTELIVLRAKQHSNPRFLYWLTRSYEFRNWGEAEMTGSAGQKRVTAEFVSNFRTTELSLLNQHRIASCLDEQAGKIDRLMEMRRRQMALLKEQMAALIQMAVTRGLNPNAPMKDSGIPWLGEIPAHWDVIKLKYLACFKSGDSITSDEIDESGEYPVFGGNGLRGYTSAYTHDGHYVLVGRQGALCGNVNYAIGKFWASEHAVVASLVSENEIIWFGEMLRVMNLNQYSQSAAQPGLAVEKIQNLYAPVPSHSEQIIISRHIESESAKLENLISAYSRQLILLTEYRAALIHECVTGQRPVTDRHAQAEGNAHAL